MMLKLYGDESGTHEGSDVVVLCGLIESREYWEHFNRKWKCELDKYGAEFFHYREFRESANTSLGAPYYGWTKEKRNSFIFRLAMLVGESAVSVGGGSRTKRIDGASIAPNEAAVRNFFESTIAMLNLHWPQYDGKLLIILDCSKNKGWTGLLHKIHSEYRNKDSRIGDLSFENDKDPKHLALQAADFSSVHFRNGAHQYVSSNEGKRIDATLIDFIVHKNQDIRFRGLDKKRFKKMVLDIRSHEAKQRELWRRQGIKRTYYPLDDFPFSEYGYKK